MSKTTERKPTRQERLAQARTARRRKDRLWRVGIPLVGIVGIIVVAFLITSQGDESGTNPSDTSAVTAGAPSLTGQTGETVPGFSAPGLTGGTVAWDDYRGSPAILTVWAPWCPHCQVEMPVLAKVAAEFPDVPVVTVVTSIGEQPGPTPEEFMAERDLTWPVAVDDADHTIANALGVQGFPTTYVVGSDGNVVQAFSGETPDADLRAAFQQVAREKGTERSAP